MINQNKLTCVICRSLGRVQICNRKKPDPSICRYDLASADRVLAYLKEAGWKSPAEWVQIRDASVFLAKHEARQQALREVETMLNAFFKGCWDKTSDDGLTYSRNKIAIILDQLKFKSGQLPKEER